MVHTGHRIDLKITRCSHAKVKHCQILINLPHDPVILSNRFQTIISPFYKKKLSKKGRYIIFISRPRNLKYGREIQFLEFYLFPWQVFALSAKRESG